MKSPFSQVLVVILLCMAFQGRLSGASLPEGKKQEARLMSRGAPEDIMAEAKVSLQPLPEAKEIQAEKQSALRQQPVREKKHQARHAIKDDGAEIFWAIGLFLCALISIIAVLGGTCALIYGLIAGAGNLVGMGLLLYLAGALLLFLCFVFVSLLMGTRTRHLPPVYEKED